MPINMRSIILLWFFVISPLFLYAQAAGGKVTRPANKTNKEHQTNVHNQRNDKAVSQTSRDIIIKNLMNNMVYVEGGVVTLKKCNWTGGRDSFKEESLSSFSICKYEVTQEEWKAVMGNNPSKFKGDKRPVENASWGDCQEFIHKLNTMTGQNFRLPTGAEWYFAARGGKKSMNYKYSGSNNVSHVAWYSDNSKRETHPVGTKRPNEFGIYDMSGNVMEWCQDKYPSSEFASHLCCGGHCWVLAGFQVVDESKCTGDGTDYENEEYAKEILGLRLAL